MNLRKCTVALVVAGFASSLAFSINYLATAETTPGKANQFPADHVKEVEAYKSWTKVNRTPLLMPARVAFDCAIPAFGAGGASNPHSDKYFTVYVNEVGRSAMLNQRNPKFPVGSIIVKEKLPARDSRTPELLTVMIKQKEGFNPTGGDWEYMVLDGSGTRVEGRGKLKSCQSCHVAQPQTDYVFRTYLTEDVKSNLQ